jgi:prevent-host-death family protein
MATFSSSEARNRFRELLDRVTRGEEIVITRDDKPVARVVPEGQKSLDGVRRSAESMRRMCEQMSKRKGFTPLSDKEIKDAINKGHR